MQTHRKSHKCMENLIKNITDDHCRQMKPVTSGFNCFNRTQIKLTELHKSESYDVPFRKQNYKSVFLKNL